jgi:anthranilate phosphoribosyltransferase
MIQDALRKLIAREDLTHEEMARVMSEIADGQASATLAAAFLATLRAKGETVTEIAAAAQVMRARVDKVQVLAPIFIDTCGTGGDGQHTFNISTTAAFVVAGAGVTVAKHGNRSVSSRCGSADVLAALGVDVDAEKARVEECIAQVGIGFLFAPRLHPAFKAVAPIRKELGVRTVFNLLGPLVNPAGARRQVMGVYDAHWVPILGGVLLALGSEDAYVVHGGGLDEISLSGPTDVSRVKNGSVETFVVTPEELGLPRSPLSALAGGDAATNARIARDVLSGQKGAPRDAVLANAAAGLVVGSAAQTLAEGVILAAKVIDSGGASAKLEALVRKTRREA